jgi:hypothetical protein
LVEGLDNVSRYVSSLDRKRIGEVRSVLESVSGVDGRTLASRRDLSGVARILIASLKSDDIAYLLLESGGMDSFVKTIIYREVRLDVNAILERLRALGLYRYVGEVCNLYGPSRLYRGLLDSSTALRTAVVWLAVS